MHVNIHVCTRVVAGALCAAFYANEKEAGNHTHLQSYPVYLVMITTTAGEFLWEWTEGLSKDVEHASKVG